MSKTKIVDYTQLSNLRINGNRDTKPLAGRPNMFNIGLGMPRFDATVELPDASISKLGDVAYVIADEELVLFTSEGWVAIGGLAPVESKAYAGFQSTEISPAYPYPAAGNSKLLVGAETPLIVGGYGLEIPGDGTILNIGDAAINIWINASMTLICTDVAGLNLGVAFSTIAGGLAAQSNLTFVNQGSNFGISLNTFISLAPQDRVEVIVNSPNGVEFHLICAGLQFTAVEL